MDQPPVANGAILIDDRGRVLAVGPEESIPHGEALATRHFADAVLLPGFINTHTHLELTALETIDDGKAMPSGAGFLPWLRHVMALRATRTEEQLFNGAVAGIQAGWAAGVTTVCDTGSSGAVIAALDHLGASGTAHHEVFGPHPEQFDRVMPEYLREIDRLARHATGRVQLGLSPHAPYSVSGQLYRATADVARAHGAPLAVHIAESGEETALLDDFSGPFAEMFRSREIPRPAAEPVTPVAWIEQHGVLGERTLCIHAVHVGSSDIDRLVRTRSAVAHCPRSNRHHHQADAPLRALIEHGVRVGLGTDSVLSVSPSDLLAEARAAAVLAGWSAADALRALTRGGADAIGLTGQCGQIAVGEWADLVAVRTGITETPEQAVLSSGPGDVITTWVGGRAVWESGVVSR